MNIVVIPTWYRTANNPNGGIFVCEEIKALKKEGVNGTILFVDLDFRNLKSVFSSPVISETNFNDILEIRADGFGFPKVNLKLVEKWSDIHLQLMKKYLDKNPTPELIHAHSFFGGYAAMRLSEKYNIPYIVTEHFSAFLTGKIEPWKKEMIRSVFDKADKLIVVSEHLKNKVKDYTSNSIEVIPNAIDTQFFKPPNLHNNKNTFQFITVGGVRKEKRYDELVKAFCKLPLEIKSKCALKIIGNGPLENELIQQINNLPKENDVQYLGELSREEVLKNLQESDAFVCSSLYETFGIAVLEAMSVGLPVISTRCQGPEVFINKDTGVLTSIEEMDNQLLWMFNNHNQFDRKKISDFVKGKFDISILTKQRIKIYQNVLDPKKNSGQSPISN